MMEHMLCEGCDSWGSAPLIPHTRRSIKPFDTEREMANLPILPGNTGLAHTMGHQRAGFRATALLLGRETNAIAYQG